jgi:predicted MFS family arabinose efflux permease
MCALVCIVLQLIGNHFEKANDSKKDANAVSARFTAFQRNYILIYLLAMFSDWLQGPYVYQLYVSYGFDQQAIAELFVCGFGSSMIVGTFIGGMADKMGRKNACVLYSITYIMACCTKMVPEYWTLMLGRFLSGVSTSLLFSVFESWMVCEHQKQGFDSALLGSTFSNAIFGNGLVAVGAGFVANAAASSYGYIAPFVVAILPLATVAFLVSTTWSENYGNQQSNMLGSLRQGFELIQNDSRIAALGLAQSCFEGSMYTFVFMWTPALKTDEEEAAEIAGIELPDSTSNHLGMIFAIFMVSVMIGSSVFKIATQSGIELYRIPLFLHAVAMTNFGMTSMFIEDKNIVLMNFLCFEATVGVFYPAYGVIKSEKIPEDIRAAVMNIFRIPLNFFVVLLLLKVKFLSPRTVFTICTFAQGVSLACYYFFYSTLKKAQLDGEHDKHSDLDALLGEKDETV